MKNLFKNPKLYVGAWFIGVSIFAILVGSCGVHTQCNGYLGIEHKYQKQYKRGYGSDFQVMNDGRALFIDSTNR